MIKKIKNWICKILHIKQCACPEKDEDFQSHKEVLKTEIPKWKCETHTRFKKSCPRCLEIVGVK